MTWGFDTGNPATPGGYLRHVDMYREAGVDLREEPLVGVGALLFRSVREAAEIVEVLHAAGVTRLHTFGGKGRLLDAVGHLLVSTDSAGWSAAARRRRGPCPHGVVAWERNCPVAAREWGEVQRQRAALAGVLRRASIGSAGMRQLTLFDEGFGVAA